VTHRQRPETASDVMSVTCEDETGAVNIIACLAIQERFRIPLLAARLPTASGRYEKVGEMHHLVAE